MLEVVERKDVSLAEAAHQKIDAVEDFICAQDTVVELPVEHVVTPGLYRRTLRAQKDVLATTYIHKQTHQFVVTRGKVAVSLGEGSEAVEVEAPYFGITQAGTRRVCFVLEDAEWTTYHPIPEGMESVDEIEAHIFDVRTRPDGTNAKALFKEALERKRLTA